MNYISPQEAAKYCGVKFRTLQLWRSEGRGPRYYKRGNRVLYKPSDIDAWIEKSARTSTQEVSHA